MYRFNEPISFRTLCIPFAAILCAWLLLSVEVSSANPNYTSYKNSEPNNLLVAAVDTSIPLNQPNPEKEKLKQLSKREKESAVSRKSSDIQKFAMIWFLAMLGGFIVWRMVRKNKSWHNQETSKIEEEEEEIEIIKDLPDIQNNRIRDNLVSVALEWQDKYGVSPVNLNVIAGWDAAILAGMSDEDYASYQMERKYQSLREVDFVYHRQKILVKAFRQIIPLEFGMKYVSKPLQTEWNLIIFILYDSYYSIIGAWQMSHEEYMLKLGDQEKLTPEDYQKGKKIYSGGT
ncbi:MAG: hypothetical protein H7839_00210 [Magnetococcus sp. YQC-5]